MIDVCQTFIRSELELSCHQRDIYDDLPDASLGASLF